MYLSASTMWVLIGAVLVFFMQAGFAMVETGFTRAKNAVVLVGKRETVANMINNNVISARYSNLSGLIEKAVSERKAEEIS